MFASKVLLALREPSSLLSVKHELIFLVRLFAPVPSVLPPYRRRRLRRTLEMEHCGSAAFWILKARDAAPRGNLIFCGPSHSRSRFHRIGGGKVGRFIMHFLLQGGNVRPFVTQRTSDTPAVGDLTGADRKVGNSIARKRSGDDSGGSVSRFAIPPWERETTLAANAISGG